VTEPLHNCDRAVTHVWQSLRYVVYKDNKGGMMFDLLTDELLDLTVTPKGRRAAAYALLLSCCSCCSCCGSRTDD